MQTERASSPVERREVIGEVEEVARLLIDVRAILLQPQNFRRLHLRRDFAANVPQYRVARGIDLFRLPGGAMIHPDNNVAVRIVRRPTASGASLSPITTSEQVASKPIPAIDDGETPALATAVLMQ